MTQNYMYVAGICGNYHKSSGCFEYLQKPLLKSSSQKKILAKIFLPKKSRNQKFQTQKNPSITPITWNPEYPASWVGPIGTSKSLYWFRIPVNHKAIS